MKEMLSNRYAGRGSSSVELCSGVRVPPIRSCDIIRTRNSRISLFLSILFCIPPQENSNYNNNDIRRARIFVLALSFSLMNVHSTPLKPRKLLVPLNDTVFHRIQRRICVSYVSSQSDSFLDAFRLAAKVVLSLHFGVRR